MVGVRRNLSLVLAVLLCCASLAAADDPKPCPERQSMDDAWWTGPMLAPSANTLPRGHYLVEPYIFNVISHGYFDHDGKRHPRPRTNTYGNLTYINFGITDRFTMGLIPTEGYSTSSVAPDATRLGMGDLTVQAQYRFTSFRPGHHVPMLSLSLQEKLPTGRYDRLGDRPMNAQGAGAHTSTVSVYTQYYFWLPNGRILRTRFNVSQSFSDSPTVRDESVYGTSRGFRGQASPGKSFWVDSSWEYSLTKRFVLATDLTYEHDGNTHVFGHDGNGLPVVMNSGTSDAFGLAPAIEYSWRPNLGVLLGVRLFPAGRNTSTSITPAIAINFFR